ncbi:energy-coupling factor ABC transporter transmembrane protein [Sodalis sp. RH20]|uniref:energy-coupling factor ABC transporter transmembrane protein n=1 Tax=unclassified Sodalis (in: enterobacteria) TaxID=2636512 RepID=UPI0039B4402C
MLEIDRLSWQNRWQARDPMRKFVLYAALLGIALLTSPLYQCATLLLLIPLTCYVARVNLARYLRWLSVPLGFLAVSLLSIAVSFAWSGGGMIYSVRLGSLYLGLDKQGLALANLAMWRSMTALAATYLFVLTTPFTQIIQILKRCRLPRLLIEHTLLSYRFIFIFLDEANAIRQAQSLRFGYCSLRTGYHSLAMLVGMLMLRVITRYREMSVALEVKLYQGEFHL